MKKRATYSNSGSGNSAETQASDSDSVKVSQQVSEKPSLLPEFKSKTQ